MATVVESWDAPQDVRSDVVRTMCSAEEDRRYQIKDGMALEGYDKILRE